MKKMIAVLVAVIALGAGCAGGAGGGGLGSNGISDAEGASIHQGMSMADVKSALGKPESITKSDSSFMGETTTMVTFMYGGSNDSSWIFGFTDGKLDSKSHL